MDWYYHDGSEQQGPVPEAEFAKAISEGKVNGETFVWNNGLDNWKALKEVRPDWSSAFESAAAATPPVEGQEACLECGNPFAREEMVEFDQGFVCSNCKDLYVQKLREGVETAKHYEYAGFWIRFAAKFIDGLIMGVFNFAVQILLLGSSAVFGAAAGAEDTVFGLAYIATTLFLYAVHAVYDMWFIGKFQATPGKMACGLKVIRADGSAPTYARGLGRHFAEFVSMLTLYIGYIMAGFDQEKRSLHDRIADTRVVRK